MHALPAHAAAMLPHANIAHRAAWSEGGVWGGPTSTWGWGARGAGFIRSRVSNDDARGGRSTRRASRMARARSRENRRVDESARDAPVTPPPARAARRARSEEKLEREPSSRARRGMRRDAAPPLLFFSRRVQFFSVRFFSTEIFSGAAIRSLAVLSAPRARPPQGWLSPGISSKR
jgi:hypothetical protein